MGIDKVTYQVTVAAATGEIISEVRSEAAMESTVGAGSKFWFELNLVAEPLPVVSIAKPLASLQMVKRAREPRDGEYR